MDTLLSYSLHDLLIFSPDAYIQLYEIANKALWPWHLVLIGMALSALYFLESNQTKYRRFIFIWLGLVWIFVAYWFIDQHYSQIFGFAYIASLFFYVQALLLFLFGIVPPPPIRSAKPNRVRNYIVWSLIVGGYCVYPLASLLFWDKAATSVQIFSVAPDPTAISTLGFLLMIKLSKGGSLLFAIPILWLFFSVLTHTAFVS